MEKGFDTARYFIVRNISSAGGGIPFGCQMENEKKTEK